MWNSILKTMSMLSPSRYPSWYKNYLVTTCVKWVLWGFFSSIIQLMDFIYFVIQVYVTCINQWTIAIEGKMWYLGCTIYKAIPTLQQNYLLRQKNVFSSTSIKKPVTSREKWHRLGGYDSFPSGAYTINKLHSFVCQLIWEVEFVEKWILIDSKNDLGWAQPKSFPPFVSGAYIKTCE